eukprot:GHUV01042027.1.p2 GENE.GHUV01042027.1~~GHUV01042027.1.p2  ORF type:complete len:102 (+),score=16.99 GHUV01042027.1:125-430(+)
MPQPHAASTCCTFTTAKPALKVASHPVVRLSLLCAVQLGCAEGLPESVPEELLQDDGFLQKFHHALLEVCLEEGSLVCPETGRRFPVSKGIPNMLLNEDEV